jgi:hypothetical protein
VKRPPLRVSPRSWGYLIRLAYRDDHSEPASRHHAGKAGNSEQQTWHRGHRHRDALTACCPIYGPPAVLVSACDVEKGSVSCFAVLCCFAFLIGQLQCVRSRSALPD